MRLLNLLPSFKVRNTKIYLNCADLLLHLPNGAIPRGGRMRAGTVNAFRSFRLALFSNMTFTSALTTRGVRWTASILMMRIFLALKATQGIRNEWSNSAFFVAYVNIIKEVRFSKSLPSTKRVMWRAATTS